MKKMNADGRKLRSCTCRQNTMAHFQLRYIYSIILVDQLPVRLNRMISLNVRVKLWQVYYHIQSFTISSILIGAYYFNFNLSSSASLRMHMCKMLQCSLWQEGKICQFCVCRSVCAILAQTRQICIVCVNRERKLLNCYVSIKYSEQNLG